MPALVVNILSLTAVLAPLFVLLSVVTLVRPRKARSCCAERPSAHEPPRGPRADEE